MAYLWTRKIPFQLKVIQGRIVAQGFLLAGCCLAAVASYYVPQAVSSTGRSGARVNTSKYDLDLAPKAAVSATEALAEAAVPVARAELR